MFKSRATVSSASFHQKIKVQPHRGKVLLDRHATDRQLTWDLGHLICKGRWRVPVSNTGTRCPFHPSRQEHCRNNLNRQVLAFRVGRAGSSAAAVASDNLILRRFSVPGRWARRQEDNAEQRSGLGACSRLWGILGIFLNYEQHELTKSTYDFINRKPAFSAHCLTLFKHTLTCQSTGPVSNRVCTSSNTSSISLWSAVI